MRNVRMSKIQKQIFDYVKESINDRGYPPAVREICEAVSLKSTSSVHSHLETLEKKGYIRRDPTKPRTIEIIDDCFQLTRREVVRVPLLGTVAAGQPLYAEEKVDNYFPIPADLLPNAETFMLKIRGNSMIKAGILDGDQIIVEQCPIAENGEIVVALIGDSATVKRFYRLFSFATRKRLYESYYCKSCKDFRKSDWCLKAGNTLAKQIRATISGFNF